MTLSLCVLGPLFEELLFRGALLHALAPYGGRFAALVSALLFAMMHGNFMQGVPTFIIGLYLAWITLRAGCILAAILAHMIYNTYANAAVGDRHGGQHGSAYAGRRCSSADYGGAGLCSRRCRLCAGNSHCRATARKPARCGGDGCCDPSRCG